MFSQQRGQFSSGQQPWFRLGEFDVGTSALAAFAVFFGMLVSVAEGGSASVTKWLRYSGDDILSGQIWRLVTWFVPNDPDIWIVVSIAMIYLIGMRIEALLGRVGLLKFLVAVVFSSSLIALLLHVLGQEIQVLPTGYVFSLNGFAISSALFVALVLAMPGAQSFFGLPLWALIAVLYVVRLLVLIQDRWWADVYLELVVLGATMVIARAFGLAEAYPWIPDVRPLLAKTPGGGTSAGSASSYSPGSPRKPLGRRGRKAASDTPIVAVDSSFEEMGIDEILDQISAFGMDSLSPSQKKKLDAYSKGRKKD